MEQVEKAVEELISSTQGKQGGLHKQQEGCLSGTAPPPAKGQGPEPSADGEQGGTQPYPGTAP